MMYNLVRKALFKLNEEISHELSMDLIGAAGRLGLSQFIGAKPLYRPTKVMGINFPNCVGLAAGLDKNGDSIEGLGALGFGFIEIGTVTPRPQPGNPTPRLFRLPEHQAIINRMGFNNKGVDHLVSKVARCGYEGVLGINIGKNVDTPVENAVDDYLICMDKVYQHSTYITVNISSPNTPGLRDLQFGNSLDELLGKLKDRQALLETKHGRYVPLTVKIAPDMDEENISQVAEALLTNEMDGVIATNTTISREAVQGHQYCDEAGGLSGAPLTEKSTEVIRSLSKVLDGRMPIIGVGGIMTGQDGKDKIDAGASLVQIYSGFIYRGPELISDIVNAVGQLDS